MNCQIIRDPTLYPAHFPDHVDLNTIDPFTLDSLYQLSQRAFKVGMPYFAFSVATLESGRYAYYDAVSFRLSQYNQTANCRIDPETRLRIIHVDYFAIANEDQNQWVAASFPSIHYFNLGFPKERMERYIFSALNYHVIEEESSTKIEMLKKIHSFCSEVLQLPCQSAREDENSAISTWSEIEKSKWQKIKYK